MNDFSAKDYNDTARNAQALESAFRSQPKDVLNRLFFAARNGAISNMLREVERYFRDRDLEVRADWKESSFGSPHVELVLVDKRTGEHKRMVMLKRTDAGTRDLPSNLVYTLEGIDVGAYYTRKPKIAETFETLLADEGFQTQMRLWVAGTNHPFEYRSHSSF